MSPETAHPAEDIRIAVLGSARLERGTPEWDIAFRVGQLLAGEGWIVVTGGYGGLMGAVAEGARDCGGHAIGLPMTPWTNLEPYPAHAELSWNTSYGERIDKIVGADAVVALPGGVGSLAEWTMAWASAQTEGSPRVLVLLGHGWSSLVGHMRGVLIAGDEDYEWLELTDEPDDVPARITAGLARRHRSVARG
jgi:uncharacterized protein (TIGR00730 family)